MAIWNGNNNPRVLATDYHHATPSKIHMFSPPESHGEAGREAASFGMVFSNFKNFSCQTSGVYKVGPLPVRNGLTAPASWVISPHLPDPIYFQPFIGATHVTSFITISSIRTLLAGETSLDARLFSLEIFSICWERLRPESG